MSAFSAARPGWYPDPSGQRGQERFWNGVAWTAQVRASRTQRTRTATVAPSARPAAGAASAGPHEIIPARPLRLEDIISGAGRLVAVKPGWLVGFPAAVSVVMVLVWFGIAGMLGGRVLDSLDAGAASFITTIVALFLLVFAVELAAFAVIATAVVVVAEPQIRGKTIDAAIVRARIIASTPRLAAYMVVYGVLSLAPYVAAAAILALAPILLVFVPAVWACTVWLLVRYSLAIPITLVDGTRTIDAMRRSDQLIRGSWWRALGIQVVALALMWCGLIVGYAVTFGIGLFLIGVAWAFYVAVVVLLYHDLELRRERTASLLRMEGSDD